MKSLLKTYPNVYVAPAIEIPPGIQEKIIDNFNNYIRIPDNQVNIFAKPPIAKDIEIEYTDGVILAIPNHKIIVLNLNVAKQEDFDDYYEDIISCFDYMNKRYGYEEKLGKIRKWKNDVIIKISDYHELTSLESYKIPGKINEKNGKRFINYVISLSIGSQNPSENIVLDDDLTILERIKNKIVIYDTKQKEFLFSKFNKKKITIQGLAGTGKTELLIQKIKDIYISEENSTIVMTCYNRVLSESLQKRIPELFDAYKVDKQIEWNERLFVMRAWGSHYKPFSGFYSFICEQYKIPFYAYNYYVGFDTICKLALKELNKIKDFKPLFDYTFIDESQDFPKSFFQLADKVTKKKLIIAGDVFQNVFDNMAEKTIEPNIILKNSYRTSPETLIFSHLLSMGMLEGKDRPLRWLKKEEWENCGYKINQIGERKIEVKRDPIRRFEDDINDQVDFIKIIKYNEAKVISRIIRIIKQIKSKYLDVKPHDIAIVFLENTDYNYRMFDSLELKIKEKIEWEVNKAYNTKKIEQNQLFLSNRNNIKGLEFPFIISITSGIISDSKQFRNALYMALTRSFITSYLLISNENNPETIENLEHYVDELKQNRVVIDEPSEEVKKTLYKQIISQDYLIKSKKEIAESCMIARNIPQKYRSKIHKNLENIIPEDADREKIDFAVKNAYDTLVNFEK